MSYVKLNISVSIQTVHPEHNPFVDRNVMKTTPSRPANLSNTFCLYMFDVLEETKRLVLTQKVF